MRASTPTVALSVPSSSRLSFTTFAATPTRQRPSTPGWSGSPGLRVKMPMMRSLGSASSNNLRAAGSSTVSVTISPGKSTMRRTGSSARTDGISGAGSTPPVAGGRSSSGASRLIGEIPRRGSGLQCQLDAEQAVAIVRRKLVGFDFVRHVEHALENPVIDLQCEQLGQLGALAARLRRGARTANDEPARLDTDRDGFGRNAREVGENDEMRLTAVGVDCRPPARGKRMRRRASLENGDLLPVTIDLGQERAGCGRRFHGSG